MFEDEASDQCDFGAVDIDGQGRVGHFESHKRARRNLKCERAVEAVKGFVDGDTEVVDLQFNQGGLEVDRFQDVFAIGTE